jgi:transmembrane sensor
MSENEREDNDQLWSEATLWFARMRSPDAEGFRGEFEEWLARGALHRRYYNRAAEHWLHGTAAYAEERALIHGVGNQQPEPTPETRSKRGAIAAMIAGSIVVGGSAMLYLAGDRRDVGPAERPGIAAQAVTGSVRLATAAREQRRVQLADGSVVVLGGDTQLEVQFAAAMRDLRLDRGNARFEVAHEARPFVVLAGGGSVTAHGTIFDVGITPDHRVSVRLIRGCVDVRFPAPERAKVEPRRLHPGEVVSFEATVARASDPARAIPATTAGQEARDYRDVPLAEIVGEANRNAVVPIRLADPAIAQQQMSGRFRIDDTAVLAERLAALLDLVLDRTNPSEIVLRRK